MNAIDWFTHLLLWKRVLFIYGAIAVVIFVVALAIAFLPVLFSKGHEKYERKIIFGEIGVFLVCAALWLIVLVALAIDQVVTFARNRGLTRRALR